MFKSVIVFISLILVTQAAYTTYYANEQCGNDIQLDRPVIFRSSRDGTLPSGFNCTVYFKGILSVIGGLPLVMARFLKVNMPPGNGVNCTDARIDIVDGLRSPRPITNSKGICGSLPPQPYDYVTTNDSFMAVKISTIGPQSVDFQIIMQSFQKVENGEQCFPGEFECNNNRCIRDLNKCDGYDNCGDLSDETYNRCKPTLYLDEICGLSLTVYDMIKLKSSRSKNLIPALACRVDLSSQTGGGFGGSPRILAHVRNMDLQPATLGVCQRSRIDMYDGIRDPFLISGQNGICGTGAGSNYATYNDSFLSLELKTDPQPQIGSFEFTVTSFHVNTGQGCNSGEWQCGNGRCIDDYLRCNGYNNCGDNSDETDDLCIAAAALAGGAIAAIVIGALLFAVGFPLLMFYVLCHRKQKHYSSI